MTRNYAVSDGYTWVYERGVRRRVPSIARIDGIVIFIYGLDHNPPHFHARYAEHIVKLSIEDLTILAGHMPRPQLRAVVRWAGENGEYLKQCWNAAAAGEAMP